MYIVYIYIYISIYDSNILHHHPCFNLLILYNNPFENQGSEININNIFLNFSTYCLLRKVSSNYTFNKFSLAIIALVLDFVYN